MRTPQALTSTHGNVRSAGFEICPGFWTWIEKTHAAGAIHSVARVGEELRAGDDRLAEWAKQQSELFVAADEPTVEALREVSNLAVAIR